MRGLVDRRPERSGAWRRVAEDQRKVVVVRGKPDVGKTAFVHLLMERCALRSHQLRYVDLAGTNKVDVLTVLWRICNGDGGAVDDLALNGPLPAAAFQPFKDAVQEVLGAPLSPDSNWSNIQQAIDRKRIVENFQKGLEQSISRASPGARARPLTGHARGPGALVSDTGPGHVVREKAKP